jgi:hypothetical protein
MNPCFAQVFLWKFSQKTFFSEKSALSALLTIKLLISKQKNSADGPFSSALICTICTVFKDFPYEPT